MTTIINPGNSNDNSGTGMIIGVVITIILVVLFFIFVLPEIRKGQNPTENTIKVEIPTTPGQN